MGVCIHVFMHMYAYVHTTYTSMASAQQHGGGGAQLYAERIRDRHIEFGAPAHPLHSSRSTVRRGSIGSSAFEVDLTVPGQAFSHFFEFSVGSGHMSLTQREDWRNHLRMAAKDLGVKHIRGHGLLDDDMSVSYSRGKHAFYNVDSLVEFLSSINMRPIFELSFMPDWLTSGTNTVCHYKGNVDPPKNYSDWGELIGALGDHLVEKYGENNASEFRFEVWNEPNDNFWKGGQEGYWRLYEEAARALKASSPKLQVGGPATCCASCWIADFVTWANSNKVPFDFVSTHAYSSCGMPGLSDADRVVHEIFDAREVLDNQTRGKNSKGGVKEPVPWLITEFGANCGQGIGLNANFPSAIHDMIDQSSYTIAVIDKLSGAKEPQALSYWAVSDVFEESFFPVANESFHGAFGLVNLHGIPKPTYRAYQLLHETGSTKLSVKRPAAPSFNGTCGATIDSTDVWGGDISPPVDGVKTISDCCSLCIQHEHCDTAVLWHEAGNPDAGYKCGLKSWDARVKTTKNQERSYTRITRKPITNDHLCDKNAGVLAVLNQSSLDLLFYNHAAFADPIVACNVSLKFISDTKEDVNILLDAILNGSVRRIDEEHANPLATWISMGAPDYTTPAQNREIFEASKLQVENLTSLAQNISEHGFSIVVPPHGVIATRITIHGM